MSQNISVTSEQINKINSILKNPNNSTDSIFDVQNITASTNIKITLHLTEQSDNVLFYQQYLIVK